MSVVQSQLYRLANLSRLAVNQECDGCRPSTALSSRLDDAEAKHSTPLAALLSAAGICQQGRCREAGLDKPWSRVPCRLRST